MGSRSFIELTDVILEVGLRKYLRRESFTEGTALAETPAGSSQ
jgi:hypothetical protein